MKRSLLFVFLSSICFGSGQKHNYKDPLLNDEMDNIYRNIDKRPEFISVHQFTKANLATIVPKRVGEIYFCSDCATDAICVSTGTLIASFGRVSLRTTACQ